MQRGDLWTLAAGGDYGRKPRPSLIVQSDIFEKLDSVVVCPLTSFAAGVRTRPPLEAASENGLKGRSFVMVDKIMTVRRERLGRRIGTLSDADLARVEEALVFFLGLGTGSPLTSEGGGD